MGRILIISVIVGFAFSQVDSIQVTHEQKSRIENLQKMAEKYPDALELQYNLGNALSEIGVPAGAISAYQNALSLEDETQRSQAFYNLGNALFEASQQLSQQQNDANPEQMQETAKKSQQALEGSLQAFAQAIILNPDDSDAKWNYELVKRILEQKQQSQQNQDGEKNEEQEQSEEKQQSQEQQQEEEQAENQPKPEEQEEMSKDEAERLLQAMEQKENEQMKEMMQKRIKAGTPGKDW